MDYLAIAISVLSLIIASVVFYYTHLRQASICLHLGPSIAIYHMSGGGFAMYIPTTFINAGPRTGAVSRAAVILHLKSSPQQQYYMEWRSFSRYDPTTNGFTYDEMPHAIAVTGKSTTGKLIWFPWTHTTSPGPVLKSGDYNLVFYYWVEGLERPKVSFHELNISHETKSSLGTRNDDGSCRPVEVTLDKQLESNRLMTAHEVEKLLHK